MTAPTVTIRNGSLFYNKKHILNNINCQLPAGQWTALLGPSGIGKSSLFKLITGLHSPDTLLKGQITADNHLSIPEQIAYMAQTDCLLPWLTVLDNACLGYTLRGEKADKEKAKALLSKAGLSHAMSLYPHELSGGMRQRTALVRTLLEDKSIILMDEPFSALDTITRYQLQTLASTFLKDKTVLFITHDPAEAVRLAHHIYMMDGQPASLRSAAILSGETPRNTSNPYVLQLQENLLHELSANMKEQLG